MCRAHAAGLQGGRPGVLGNCGAPMPRWSTCLPTPRSSIASWQPSRAARGAAAHRGSSRPARGGAAIRVKSLRAVDKRSPRARGLRAPRRFGRLASTGTPQPQPPSGSDTMAGFAHRLLRRAGGTLKRLSRGGPANRVIGGRHADSEPARAEHAERGRRRAVVPAARSGLELVAVFAATRALGGLDRRDRAVAHGSERERECAHALECSCAVNSPPP